MSIIIMGVAAVAAIVVLIAAVVSGGKATGEKGGQDMIKNVYVYLVLFATLMMVIGGSVAAFMAVADIVSPVAYYQSFEEYRRYPEKFPGDTTNVTQLSEEELQTRYQAVVDNERDRQVQRAKNSLVKSLGWIVIPLPVFVYFQRHLRKKEEY